VRVGVLAQRDELNDEDTVGHAIVGDRPEYEWAGDAKVRAILAELTGDIDWDARVGTLSGGQRRRCDLARVLIGDWDVLMLDEPTNHLDIGGIHWLAEHLKGRWKPGEGALLLVTHDRWFLDEVCLDMWEVHDAQVTPFEGGYSAYIQQRVERARLARVAEEKRQNILRRELAWLARGAKARSSKPRFRVEAAQALIADEPPLRNKLELRRSAISRLGKKVIHFHNASYSWDGVQVIKTLEWNIGAGDRIAILGANGAGKSTLLELAQGKLKPTTGRVEIGQTVKFAVLSQQLDELEELKDLRVREVCQHYRSRYELADGTTMGPMQLLEELGFEADQMKCPVKDLSGGQKRRLQLMLILLDHPNVLVLDEPGNDLDTDMLAQLETLLDTWPGTLLLVSHDRYLVERVTDDQYALIDGELTHVPRGVDEYLELEDAHRKARQEGEDAQRNVQDAGKADEASGLSQREMRELKKQKNSLERKMSTARSKVEKAKNALLEIDGTDFVALGEQQAKISELEGQLSTLEDEWLEVAEKLDI
ncbi:MAG: ABC-F family ATP-binding cassette domain-containing protein, partial [Coriobacteriales bacterium]|jgi:ATP-binding cassette subfamily F protein uup